MFNWSGAYNLVSPEETGGEEIPVYSDDVLEQTSTIAEVKNVFQRLKTNSISDKELLLECESLKNSYPFISPNFFKTCLNNYGDVNHCCHVAQRNVNLLQSASWSMMDTAMIRACAESGCFMLLPTFTKSGHSIIYVRLRNLNFSKFPVEEFQKFSFLLMHKASRAAAVVVDWSGFAITEFRKISSSEIAIGQLFCDCSPVKFPCLYFLHSPWWIRLVKALTPKKHLDKIKCCNVEDMYEDDEFAPENLPSDIGGKLDFDQIVSNQLDKWQNQEAEKVRMVSKLNGRTSSLG